MKTKENLMKNTKEAGQGHKSGRLVFLCLYQGALILGLRTQSLFLPQRHR